MKYWTFFFLDKKQTQRVSGQAGCCALSFFLNLKQEGSTSELE